MAISKLNIGKIPIMKGEYQEGTTYQRLNQVTMYGSTYQSKIDNNASAPAKLGENSVVEQINTDKWLLIALGNESSAKKVIYDNTSSSLNSTTVQDAINEVVGNVNLYNCSPSGSVIYDSLQDAINTVPNSKQKSGLLISAIIKDNTAEKAKMQLFKLNDCIWNSNASMWSELKTDEKPWFLGNKSRLVNLTKCAQSLYNAIIDIEVKSDRDEFISDDYYVKIGIFSPNSNEKGKITSCLITLYLTNGTTNIAIAQTLNVTSQIDKYQFTEKNVNVSVIIDFDLLDYSDFPSFTKGYGYLILNQGLSKEYYIISKKYISPYKGVIFNNDINEFNNKVVHKSDVYADVNNIAPFNEGVPYDAYLTQAIQNQFGTLYENKFINIYGKLVNDYDSSFDNINTICASSWIPINFFTRNRVIENIYSFISRGLTGVALYHNMSEAGFIGYYTPYEEQAETTFSMSIADIIATNSDFENATYFRITKKKHNYLIERTKPLLSNLNKGALKSDGDIYEFDGDFLVSDYILLTEKVKSYTLKGLISYARANMYAISFYDKNKKIIKKAYKDELDDAVLTAPIVCEINVGELSKNYTNSSYMRFTFNKQIGLEITEPENKKYNVENIEESKWVLNQFRNVIFVGDSVTQGYVSDYPISEVISDASYPTKLGYLATGWNITNAGRSGYSPKDWMLGDPSKGKEAMFDNYDFSDKDLAVIEFGYNGGLFEDEIEKEGTNSYYYEYLIKKIKEKNKNIEIVLVIPSNGIIVRNWNSVINILAKRNNCEVIDLTEDLHIHLDNKKWHGASDANGTIDMVHFTKKGYNAKARLVFEKLIQLYM